MHDGCSAQEIHEECSDSGAAVEDARSRLELTVAKSPDGRSFIRHQYATHPFHICRAHYLDSKAPDLLTLYLQSSSGGVFRDDRLVIDARAAEGARLHVTTPASTIVHRTDPGYAESRILISAGRGSLIEYLPEPTILFPFSDFRSVIRVARQPESTVVLSESFLAHDPNDRGDVFNRLSVDIVVEDDRGNQHFIDRSVVAGEDFLSMEPGDGGYAVCGCYAILGDRFDLDGCLSAVREALDLCGGVYGGATCLPNAQGVWVRYLSVDGVVHRRVSDSLFQIVRQQLTGNPATIRRK